MIRRDLQDAQAALDEAKRDLYTAQTSERRQELLDEIDTHSRTLFLGGFGGEGEV